MAVAMTGGAPPNPDYCEKYPTEDECRGGDPLPTYLSLPRIDDYRGGMSALGLGDIVLPGLLISFAIRLDVSKRFAEFMRIYMRSGSVGCNQKQSKGVGKELLSGYFIWLILAYSVGLLIAYIVFSYTKIKEPAARLYLVPFCLGMMFMLGWKREETAILWSGPKVLKTLQHVMSLRETVRIVSIDWNEIFPQYNVITDSESNDSTDCTSPVAT